MNKSQIISRIVDTLHGYQKDIMTKPEKKIADLLIDTGYGRWIETGSGNEQFCRHKKAVK